jgi:N-acyl-L-homoserine lactone synthetase
MDEFDNEHTCYIIAKNNEGNITGCSRLLPTTQPYLLECIFPILLDGISPPKTEDIWELSRFTSMNINGVVANNGQMTGKLTQTLLWQSFSIAKQHGAKGVVSVSPLGIERLLRSMGIKGHRLGKPMNVNGYMLFACYVDFNNIYQLSFKMQVSVGTKKNLGKALRLRHGYPLTKVNNTA